MPRPFASGSRQAPDPFDQFLEAEGFYRKHTARDSSCLFRAISEQVYDLQLHHLQIRQNCVDYMRKNKNLFQVGVDIDIDDYIDEMSKPKTYGTLLELRALAYFYRRNVILFEEYNTGTWMVQEDTFDKEFRVFFTPEKHFDSVYLNDFIQTAAFCQSLCFEILYKNVFKLPDVTYAVEQMLHSTDPDEFVPVEEEHRGSYTKTITLKDGRHFEMDRPENTMCILDNHLLCHFHNKDFSQFSLALHHDKSIISKSDFDSIKISKTIHSLLHGKYVSCVRQLLDQGITPFPYKVAKALDPDIYRNIEFDAWSDMRKEQRFQNWYTGGANLQVGVKCLVRLRNSQNDLFNCYIQEMTPEKGPCVVYIEDLCEKHIVPFEHLQPLPSDQEQQWAIPYRYQRYMERCASKGRGGKNRGNGNGKRKYREEYIIANIEGLYTKNEDDNIMKHDVEYRLKTFTSFQHFQPLPCECIAMPFNVDCNNPNQDNIGNNRPSRRNSVTSGVSANGAEPSKNDATKKDQETETEFASQPQDSLTYGYPESYFPYQYESGMTPSTSHSVMYNGVQYYCMHNSSPYSNGNGIPAHSVYMPQPVPYGQQPPNYYSPHYAPISNSTTQILSTTTSNSPNPLTIANSGGNNIRRSPNISNFGRVNFNATRSNCSSGTDLPDIQTVRYFYNLGYDYYFKCIQGSNSDSIGNENIDNDAIGKLTSDFQATVKIENESVINVSSNTGKSEGNTGPQPRKFHARYFNSRNNKGGYGRGGGGGGSGNNAGHRYSSGEYSKGHNNHNNSSKNNNYSTNNGASNNNKSVAPTTSSTTSVGSSTEQVIQTSPVMVNVSNSENLVHDYNQTQVYSASHPPLAHYATSYVRYYSTDAEQSPGMYLTPPVMTLPYGVYPSVPPPQPGPPPPQHQQIGGYQGFFNAPPSSQHPLPIPQTPATYYAPTNESSSSLISAEPFDNGHYAFMGYPCSPVYYSPTTPTGTAPIPAQSAGGPAPQGGYWYHPAPQSVVNPQSGTMVIPSNGAGSHQITQPNSNISR